MDNLKIRPVQISDCSLIQELLTKEFKDSVGHSSQNVPPLLWEGVVAEETQNKSGGGIVGLGLYHKKYSTWVGPVMHLNTFIVSSEQRKKGLGTKMLGELGRIAESNNYPRISFEVNKDHNESSMSFFMKRGALNLSRDEGWLNYEFPLGVVKNVVLKALNKVEVQGVIVRPTEPKDCSQIKEMIQELADFEKMPEGPKLKVEDLQRHGFPSEFGDQKNNQPYYYSFVAQELDGIIIGYAILFPTFDPLLGKRVHLEDIYVTPNHRGWGVGKMLFHQVAKFVNEGAYQGITLEVLDWNTQAIQFYEKYGAKEQKGVESLRFVKEGIETLIKE